MYFDAKAVGVHALKKDAVRITEVGFDTVPCFIEKSQKGSAGLQRLDSRGLRLNAISNKCHVCASSWAAISSIS
jgi:hypothetical protein